MNADKRGFLNDLSAFIRVHLRQKRSSFMQDKI